jgi:hypothetical protein
MRKMVITLLALGVFAASSAFAGNLLNEAFTYPNGNLVPNDGWVIYSGAGDIQVVGNEVTGQMGVSASGADDAAPFIGAVVRPLDAPTYYCLNVKIPCATLNPSPLASYFAGLKDGGTSLMVGRAYVLPITGGWTFGISNSSTSSATVYGATQWGTTPLACDVWYTLVVKYDPSTGTSTLWVDPVSEASPSVSNVNASNAGLAVSTFFLRQGAASTFPAPGFPGAGLWKWTADNAGVGASFAEACYTAPPTTGACCLRGSEGACIVVTQAECEALAPVNGFYAVFMGAGTSCQPNPICAVPTTKTSWGQLKTIYR